MKIQQLLITAAATLTFFCCGSPLWSQETNLIPIPRSMSMEEKSFVLSSKTEIAATDPLATFAADQLTSWIKSLKLSPTAEQASSTKISFKKAIGNPLPKEAYQLRVTETEITIEASSSAGFLYGLKRCVSYCLSRRKVPLFAFLP